MIFLWWNKSGGYGGSGVAGQNYGGYGMCSTSSGTCGVAGQKYGGYGLQYIVVLVFYLRWDKSGGYGDCSTGGTCGGLFVVGHLWWLW